MNRFKLLHGLFAALAVLLSDVMCAVVAFHYCSLQWGGRYAGWSAPASVAFLLAIPFAAAIAVCALLAAVCRRKAG